MCFNNHTMNKPNHQKLTGLKRIKHAFINSISGLAYGWSESAFRAECLLLVVAIPAAVLIGKDLLDVVVLIGVVLLVLIVELLNSAIESCIDRVGLEWHALSHRSKDLGSAAVFMSLLLCVCVWGAFIYEALR
jgi:diacylglycerol kinase (ATP)